MNRQKPGGNIEWATPYGPAYYEGWTANPIQGCQAGCSWQMQNGARAQCYAKTLAEHGLAKAAYPQGFAHVRFNDKELSAILKHKNPSGIFIDSMSDLLGLGVPDEWTERVVEVMRLKREHIFFILTKNPERLPDFDWPANCFVGVSAPPTYLNKKLQMGQDLTTSRGRLNWYRKALEYLAKTNAAIKWTSIEPLSDDFSTAFQETGFVFEWAVIGTASNGRMTIQPDESHFANVLTTLEDNGVPVFFKGNIDRNLAQRHGGWREDWPYYEPAMERIAEIDAAKV
jgi:protein gp37